MQQGNCDERSAHLKPESRATDSVVVSFVRPTVLPTVVRTVLFKASDSTTLGLAAPF
jgi:hypothetical protein